VSYKYPKTIASKVFSFNKAVENMDSDTGTTGLMCECSSSPFLYGPANHVVTEILNFVKDKHMHKLLLKGPLYGKQSYIN